MIDCLALPEEPWANGGGTTRTVARGPDLDGKPAWRISLATLDGPSRFSQFAGVDRTFVLIDQESVELHAQDGALHARRGVPVRFSGDLKVWISMPAAPARALNVMTRRGHCRAHVEVVSRSARLDPSATLWLFVLSGIWQVRDASGQDVARLAPLQALQAGGHAHPLTLTAAADDARPLLASISIETLSQ